MPAKDKCYAVFLGYEKLDLCTRDSFYVKANISYKSRARSELSFEKGDVFHVTDTLPSGGKHVYTVCCVIYM